MPPTGWTHYCRRKRQGREGLWVWMKTVLFHTLFHTVCSFTHKRSLLAQVSCHVTALEALQIEEPLGQSFGSICVDAAAVGESIRAAPLQRVHAAQLRVRVAQHICEVGITRLVETNKEKKKHQCPDGKYSQNQNGRWWVVLDQCFSNFLIQRPPLSNIIFKWHYNRGGNHSQSNTKTTLDMHLSY